MQLVQQSKEKLLNRWKALSSRLSNMRETAQEMGKRTIVSGVTAGSAWGARYWWTRRKLAGKRNTFDEKGKINAFFWPGVATAVLGITPVLGEAGPYVAALGTGVAIAGGIDAVDEIATEHHKAAKK